MFLNSLFLDALKYGSDTIKYKRIPDPSYNTFDHLLLTNPEQYFYKLILPILIVLLFSLFIGLERQNMGKSAGVSAHTIVGIASVMIAIMQRLMYEFSGFNNNDGQRIIAQVVTGIGFLGAGVIMKDKYTIKGLTTAATIWATAILGLIVGSGYIIVGTVYALIIIIFMTLRDVKRGFNPFKKSKTLSKDFKVEVKKYRVIENENNKNNDDKVRKLKRNTKDKN